MTQAIFEHTSLAGIKLKNRIIRSATHEGMADEKGFPTEKLKNLYIRLAKGDAGGNNYRLCRYSGRWKNLFV